METNNRYFVFNKDPFEAKFSNNGVISIKEEKVTKDFNVSDITLINQYPLTPEDCFPTCKININLPVKDTDFYCWEMLPNNNQ